MPWNMQVFTPLLLRNGMMFLTVFGNKKNSLISRKILEVSFDPTRPKHDPLVVQKLNFTLFTFVCMYTVSVYCFFYLPEGFPC